MVPDRSGGWDPCPYDGRSWPAHPPPARDGRPGGAAGPGVGAGGAGGGPPARGPHPPQQRRRHQDVGHRPGQRRRPGLGGADRVRHPRRPPGRRHPGRGGRGPPGHQWRAMGDRPVGRHHQLSVRAAGVGGVDRGRGRRCGGGGGGGRPQQPRGLLGDAGRGGLVQRRSHLGVGGDLPRHVAHRHRVRLPGGPPGGTGHGPALAPAGGPRRAPDGRSRPRPVPRRLWPPRRLLRDRPAAVGHGGWAPRRLRGGGDRLWLRRRAPVDRLGGGVHPRHRGRAAGRPRRGRRHPGSRFALWRTCNGGVRASMEGW